MINWEKQNESPWDDIKAADFYSYPNSTVVPYVEVSLEDIKQAPRPLWITDLHPDSSIGKVVEDKEGTYWIELPETFKSYLSSLEPKYQKKFDKNLNLNQQLIIQHDIPGVIDKVWSHYVDRLNHLAARNGAENYTEEELKFRYAFYTGRDMHTLTIINPNEPDSSKNIMAVNVSQWKNSTVYDLACMINPTPEALSRSLGTFAILKNIEFAINSKISRYDLLACNYGYKTSFGAKEHKLKAIIIADDEFLKSYNIPVKLKSDINF